MKVKHKRNSPRIDILCQILDHVRNKFIDLTFIWEAHDTLKAHFLLVKLPNENDWRHVLSVSDERVDMNQPITADNLVYIDVAIKGAILY